MGGELGGEWIRVCVAESLGGSPETTTTLLIGYTPVQNKTFRAWGKKIVNLRL